MSELPLGKLETTHEVSPVFLQRAVIVAALSFVFFMAMLFGFYMRQNIGYFLLSTAFLMVYILTMFGWLMMRKNSLKVYENGIVYKKFTARWDEIESIGATDKKSFEITKINGEKVILSEAIQNIESVIKRINAEINLVH
jgi:hypothetical protein